MVSLLEFPVFRFVRRRQEYSSLGSLLAIGLGIPSSMIAVPLEPVLTAAKTAFGKNPFGEQSGLTRLLKRP